MATDVEVQYFSHLNGLVLDNNWGDMIRLLDICLVNGLPLTDITSASIDAQGDILLTTYAAHRCMLFQIIELTGFTPTELNGKYRIKGTPSENQLVLKATHVGKNVTNKGAAKLASLGYDIIFRDTNDVKRVYRAKNPRAEHPFIRVDETISDGVNNYNSSYAKSAMVGLIENMTHIDDYQDPNKLQLPLDVNDFSKNWKITGTGTTVVRGWSKWYWARKVELYNSSSDSVVPGNNSRAFTLAGDRSAFYLVTSVTTPYFKQILGCGLFNTIYDNSVVPNWFLMTLPHQIQPSTYYDATSVTAGWSLMYQKSCAGFLTTCHDVASRLKSSIFANPVLPDFKSGATVNFAGNHVAALEIPFSDAEEKLRGTLRHIYYAGGLLGKIQSTEYLSNSSMYVYDGSSVSTSATGGVYFYLGELE